MFGLFKKHLDEIKPSIFKNISITAIKAAFDLTCSTSSLAAKTDEKKFYFLYGESLAFCSCLIQMRAQGKYKFRTAEELLNFVNQILDEYKALYYSGLPTKIEFGDLSLTKDLLELVTDSFFAERTIYYCGRDYLALGISEENFKTMAKALGYVPALVRGTSDDMALVMYQISAISLLFDSNSLNNDIFNQFVSITKGAKTAWIQIFDKLLE